MSGSGSAGAGDDKFGALALVSIIHPYTPSPLTWFMIVSAANILIVVMVYKIVSSLCCLGDACYQKRCCQNYISELCYDPPACGRFFYVIFSSLLAAASTVHKRCQTNCCHVCWIPSFSSWPSSGLFLRN